MADVNWSKHMADVLRRNDIHLFATVPDYIVSQVLEHLWADPTCTVVTATREEEALGILQERRVDAVISDVRMPRMDGAEFYLKLQEQRPALAERVMFLSGDITHLAGRGLAEVPRDRVLVKPVELAELEQRIAAFVREKAA